MALLGCSLGPLGFYFSQGLQRKHLCFRIPFSSPVPRAGAHGTHQHASTDIVQSATLSQVRPNPQPSTLNPEPKRCISTISYTFSE